MTRQIVSTRYNNMCYITSSCLGYLWYFSIIKLWILLKQPIFIDFLTIWCGQWHFTSLLSIRNRIFWYVNGKTFAGTSWSCCVSSNWPLPVHVIFHTFFRFFRPGLSNTYLLSDLEVVTKRNITCLHKTEIMSSLQKKRFLRIHPSFSNLHVAISFLLIWN